MWELTLSSLQRIGFAYVRWSFFLFLVYGLLWVWKPHWSQKFRIRQLIQSKTIGHKEWYRSIRSLGWYLIPVFLTGFVYATTGYHVFYLDIAEYGVPYFFASILIFAVFYDFCFYWLHRWMHIPKIYRNSHTVHHESLNVTPLSAYSFDVYEGIINMLPYMVYVFVVPFHPLALIIAGSIGMFQNMCIHSGYEFMPKWARYNPLLKWIYTAEHHTIHHQRYNCNYSNYFTFWDKFCGTEQLYLEDGSVGPLPKRDSQARRPQFAHNA